MLRIESIAVENLRGYEYTRLPLQRLSILVGENNEGKSSLLKMFVKLLQMPSQFWDSNRNLSEQDSEFWYPANNARHRARRVTIEVKLLDGRVARRFGRARDELVDLRFAVTSMGDVRLNIGAPKRGEVHDEKARELLELLQSNVNVVFLPPIRDAQSSVFADKLTKAVKDDLTRKLKHSRQAGAPREYRLAKEAITRIQQIVAGQKGELARSADSPLSSMLRSSEVRVDLFPKHVLELIERSMYVYLSTGDHDALKVLPREVGNGLQSIIDINLSLEVVLNDQSGKKNIVIVEEPEAFLHPSAQRQFMQFLRRALVDKVESAILTTHSPIIVDEAKYEEVVLVRKHRHFTPGDLSRAAINTSLLTTASSEIFFARTVVFVEGEGDRSFFNALFRRIKAAAQVCPELSGLVFQVTGGSTFYAPWLKLARSYRWALQQPFDCMWIMDGDTAATDGGQRPVLRVAADCAFGLSPEHTDAVVAFGDKSWQSVERGPTANSDANEVLRAHGGYLFCCDLEWAILNQVSDSVFDTIKQVLSGADVTVLDDDDRESLARRLGSKIRTGQAQNGAKKQPYLRALIGESLPLDALPPEVYGVIVRILSLCFKTPQRRKAVLVACGLAPC